MTNSTDRDCLNRPSPNDDRQSPVYCAAHVRSIHKSSRRRATNSHREDATAFLPTAYPADPEESILLLRRVGPRCVTHAKRDSREKNTHGPTPGALSPVGLQRDSAVQYRFYGGCYRAVPAEPGYCQRVG